MKKSLTLHKTSSPEVNFQQKAIKNRVHISIFSNHKILSSYIQGDYKNVMKQFFLILTAINAIEHF